MQYQAAMNDAPLCFIERPGDCWKVTASTGHVSNGRSDGRKARGDKTGVLDHRRNQNRSPGIAANDFTVFRQAPDGATAWRWMVKRVSAGHARRGQRRNRKKRSRMVVSWQGE